MLTPGFLEMRLNQLNLECSEKHLDFTKISHLKDQAGNNFPIWDSFSFRANGQRSYSPVRRAGKIVAHSILLLGLKGRDRGPSGLNQTFAARKDRPFGPGCRITPLQV